MATQEYEIVVPPDVTEIVIRIRHQSAPHPRPLPPIPIYAQVTMPEHVEEAWEPLLTGVHMRFHQDTVTPVKVKAALDACLARGLKGGLVIAVHTAPGPYGGVYTRFKRRLPDGEIIPDYWSDSFFNEWLRIRHEVAEAVKDHPALAWVGMDYGLDDEAWPAKPWERVPRDWWWGYTMKYVSAAWELAKMFDPVPVVAQATTFVRQGLEILYWGFRTYKSPPNLGFKHNGFHYDPEALTGLEQKIRRFWDWCKANGRMCILEPGMVPGDDMEVNRVIAEKLLERAVTWKADSIVLQPKFVRGLAASVG